MKHSDKNKVDGIILVTEGAAEHLNPRQEISYREHRRELAVRGDRQIMFATADDDLASLLERKVGETEAFERVDLENRRR